jgi:hypothetical protein
MFAATYERERDSGGQAINVFTGKSVSKRIRPSIRSDTGAHTVPDLPILVGNVKS